FGQQRKAAVARELTKIHESILTTDLENLVDYFTLHAEKQRGEIVIVVAGNKNVAFTYAQKSMETILSLLLTELSLNKAVYLTSQITGEAKNKIYRLAIAKKTHSG